MKDYAWGRGACAATGECSSLQGDTVRKRNTIDVLLHSWSSRPTPFNHLEGMPGELGCA